MNTINRIHIAGLVGLAAISVLVPGDRPTRAEQLAAVSDPIATLAEVPAEPVSPFQPASERLLVETDEEVVEGYSAFLNTAEDGSFVTLAEYIAFTPETQQVVTTLAERGIWGNIRGADGNRLTREEISRLGDLFGVATEYVHPKPEETLYIKAGVLAQLTSMRALTLSGGASVDAITLSKLHTRVSIPIRSYRGPFLDPNEPFEGNRRIVLGSEINTSGTSTILDIQPNPNGGSIQTVLIHPSWIRPELTRVEQNDAYRFALSHLIPITPDLEEGVGVQAFLGQAFIHPDGSRLYFPADYYDLNLIQLDFYPLVVIRNKQTGQEWTIRANYYEQNFGLPTTLRYSELVSGLSVSPNPNDQNRLNWTLHRGYPTGSPYKEAVVASDLTFKGDLDWPAQSGLVESYESMLGRHPGIRLLVELGYPLDASRIANVSMQQAFIRAFDGAYYDAHLHQGSIVFPAGTYEWEITSATITIKGTDPETNESVLLTLLPEHFDPYYGDPAYASASDGDLIYNSGGVWLLTGSGSSRVSSSVKASFVSDGTALDDVELSSTPNFE